MPLVSFEDLPKFCIVLERNPARKENFLRLRETLPELRLFPAIDGTTFSDGDFVRFLREGRVSFLSTCYHQLGHIAVSLSHFALWERCVEEDYPAIVVFEDDSTIAPDFTERMRPILGAFPEDAHALFLHRFPVMPPYLTPERCAELRRQFAVAGRDAAIAPVEANVDLTAYMMTREGCRRALEHSLPMRRLFDSGINDAIIAGKLRAWAHVEEEPLIGDLPTESSINVMKKRNPDLRFWRFLREATRLADGLDRLVRTALMTLFVHRPPVAGRNAHIWRTRVRPLQQKLFPARNRPTSVR